MKDYYAILGVAETATREDVKKAFRSLAHKYHPDKQGGDEKRFKEVTEAYSILSDEQKRAQYDARRRSGFGGGSGFAGGAGFDPSQFNMDVNIEDIFGDFADLFGGGRRQRRGRDMSLEMRMTFKEAIFGTERTVVIKKQSACDTCGGTGGAPKSEWVTCTTCDGKGSVKEVQRTVLGSMQRVRTCEVCAGHGKTPKEKCSTCTGRGVVTKDEEIRIRVPAGSHDGATVRMEGRGEAIFRGTPGDLYVSIRVEKDKRFVREGSTLITGLTIKPSEALLGVTKEIESLDGMETVVVPPLGEGSDVIRIPGKGVPTGRGRGELLVEVIVEYPKKLSKKAKELATELQKEGV